MKHMPAICISH